jgi:hypothetical protein
MSFEEQFKKEGVNYELIEDKKEKYLLICGSDKFFGVELTEDQPEMHKDSWYLRDIFTLYQDMREGIIVENIIPGGKPFFRYSYMKSIGNRTSYKKLIKMGHISTDGEDVEDYPLADSAGGDLDGEGNSSAPD